MSSVMNAVIHYGFPIIGGTLGFIMSVSPLKALKTVQETGELGNLNPIPAVVFLCNCIVWLMFAVVIKDPFVFCANAPAVPVNLFIILRSYPYAPQKLRDQMERLLLGSCILTLALGVVYLFVDRIETAIQLNGNIAMLTNILLYASPLSTLGLVIKSRSSASIYLPWTLTAKGCSFTWLVYGVVMKQMPIIAPNLIGLLLSFVQLFLRLILPSRAKGEKEGQEGKNNRGVEMKKRRKQQKHKGKDLEEGKSNNSNSPSQRPPSLTCIMEEEPGGGGGGTSDLSRPNNSKDVSSSPPPPPTSPIHSWRLFDYCSTSGLTAPLTPMTVSSISLHSEGMFDDDDDDHRHDDDEEMMAMEDGEYDGDLESLADKEEGGVECRPQV